MQTDVFRAPGRFHLRPLHQSDCLLGFYDSAAPIVQQRLYIQNEVGVAVLYTGDGTSETINFQPTDGFHH